MKHHDSEEAGFFRPLQEQVHSRAMATSMREHEGFHNGMDQLLSYLDEIIGREESFDPAEFLRLLESFTDTLVAHLRNEIPAIMELGQFGNVDAIAKIWYSGVEASIKSTKAADFWTLVPMMVLCT